ncbi:hypothetical protein BSL78_06524 [Apostichopus japonicus]|uniref:RNase H type-1 domain-containing protein n=1 Tax=Stichopus japonicus TaxID=307972 RepID=A0A2G8L8H2_STIJA|nr:hypothetical protein BSL78_06524 [Apostichopus japonicus]
MIDNGHAEPAPFLDTNKKHWYLPMFGVHHPQKPDQIRVVFDSSAEFKGTSLNKVLLSGPDLNNSLVGVLMRFRKEPTAFMADIQQMFYCFFVKEEHRDFLRFMWFEDNDMSKDVIDYRMNVHVFGNSPSPAVAIYCMRKAADEGEATYGEKAKQFVKRNFYVDDGLTSVSTAKEAIDLLTNTRKMLAESNLNLHKIASNNRDVMEAFEPVDRAKDLQDIDLTNDPLPTQRSLGILWNLKTDAFAFKVSCEDKSFTHRGILSTVNSLYDPLGLVAPVTLHGKVLVRELTSGRVDWDAPLSPDKEEEWNQWRDSLQALQQLSVPRCYTKVSLSSTRRKELCIFADASEKAIGAVAYLRATDNEGNPHVGFVMGKSKLAPRPAHTIPRLELCAAVLATEMFELINEEIEVKFDAVKFFTDSRVVLGYINNTSKRFYVYVANRVNRIRQSTQSNQWHYVPTEHNPADLASRPTLAADLLSSAWFSGPKILNHMKELELFETNDFDLVEPERDAEIRPEVTTLLTKVDKLQLGSQRFQRFSSWQVLCRTIAGLIRVVLSFKKPGQGDWKALQMFCTPVELYRARSTIIRCVQQEIYPEEMTCIMKGRPIPNDSPIIRLNPVLDKDGVLRVGGRLPLADLAHQEKHPVVIPRSNHIAVLIVRHYHQQVAHQGRHITEGAIRTAGYWIVGSKGLVSATIHKCVICRRLRRYTSNPEDGGLASRSSQPWSTLHQCWPRCLRAMEHRDSTHQRWQC